MTDPSHSKKHDVPLWVYIASNISMRFHGVHQFHAYPYIVRAGGMVQAFGPKMGSRRCTRIPETSQKCVSALSVSTSFALENWFNRRIHRDERLLLNVLLLYKT